VAVLEKYWKISVDRQFRLVTSPTANLRIFEHRWGRSSTAPLLSLYHARYFANSPYSWDNDPHLLLRGFRRIIANQCMLRSPCLYMVRFSQDCLRCSATGKPRLQFPLQPVYQATASPFVYLLSLYKFLINTLQVGIQFHLLTTCLVFSIKYS
jgi:hypothetical protein